VGAASPELEHLVDLRVRALDSTLLALGLLRRGLLHVLR